jgi:putative sporulation protein YtxC
MTVRITELASAFAVDALERKLQGGGFAVQRARCEQERLTVAWEDGSFDVLRAIVRLFLASDWLNGYIERRVATVGPFLKPEERQYLALLTFHAVKHEEEHGDGPVQAWLDPVMAAADPLFWQASLIHLDGIVRFRARDFLVRVDLAVETMLEHFLADREYEEFVAMLRYMLDAQPQSPQALHVYCTDTKVWICDASGNLVRDAEVCKVAEDATDGEEVDPEDLAMSILITRAPYSLVIHDVTTMAPWPSFAETVERVFLDRARRCPGCDHCREVRRMQAVQLLSPPHRHTVQGPDGT